MSKKENDSKAEHSKPSATASKTSVEELLLKHAIKIVSEMYWSWRASYIGHNLGFNPSAALGVSFPVDWLMSHDHFDENRLDVYGQWATPNLFHIDYQYADTTPVSLRVRYTRPISVWDSLVQPRGNDAGKKSG